MTVLLDNTILSNFSAVQRPDLVRLAFVEQVITTVQAFQELHTGVTVGKVPTCDWEWMVHVTLTPAEQGQFHNLAAYLGTGEASCLAVASQRGYKVATDDRDARRWARQRGIPLTGTIGILAALVKGGHLALAEGDRLLRDMIAAGYHSPVKTLEYLLNNLGWACS